jgi:hypothetical protein
VSAADDFVLPPREASPLPPSVDQTTWKTLEVLCGYRIVLAMVVAAAFGFFSATSASGRRHRPSCCRR